MASVLPLQKDFISGWHSKIRCYLFTGTQGPDGQHDGQMLALSGYHGYFHYAEKKGYSGVGIYCRAQPQQIKVGLGVAEFDAEGRYLRADFADFSVGVAVFAVRFQRRRTASVKFKFMAVVMPHLRELRAQRTGDIDLWRLEHCHKE